MRILLLADELQEVIIAAARRLDQTGVPINHFGIQFAQIGDDEDATEALKELDEGIAEAHGIRVSSDCAVLASRGNRILMFYLGYG